MITPIEQQLPFYFKGVGIDFEQEPINRPNGHKSYQWIQCRSGKGELTVNGTTYTISEGQGMLLFPHEPHSYHALTPSWRVDWVILKGTSSESFIKNILGIETSTVYYIASPHIISTKMENLYESALKGAGSAYNCSSIVYNILLYIKALASLSESASFDDNYAHLLPVIRYINKNFSKPLTLTELAEIINVTPQHLCYKFKKVTSMTIFEYIRLVRIRFAKEQLSSNRQLSVKEIAHLAGFNDESYFSSTFKKTEGITPIEFRNINT